MALGLWAAVEPSRASGCPRNVTDGISTACHRWLQRTNVTLVLLGVAWSGFFFFLDLTLRAGRLVRGQPDWQGEHTIALVAAVVGLVAPRLLRPRPEAASTLVHGRLEGLRDAAASALPTSCAAVIMLATVSPWFPDIRCCPCAPPDIVWDPWWSLYSIAPSIVASVVAATGLGHARQRAR